MTEIDVIMGMLDWNNSAEEQAAGLAQAAQVENFQVFLQPCTEHYNKNVWDNCAKALTMRSDAELDACLENLLAWLRDMNWPGAFLILERLQAFLGGAPSGDRGKPSVRAGAWGRGMGGESQKTAKL